MSLHPSLKQGETKGFLRTVLKRTERIKHLIQKGLWKGLSFKSEILEYSSKLKGLQVTNNFLTLPDSPMVLFQQVVENHSEAPRTFMIENFANCYAKVVTDVNMLFTASAQAKQCQMPAVKMQKAKD